VGSTTASVVRAAPGVALRLVLFNAQRAAAERSRRQAEWVAALPGADSVFVTEVGPGPGGRALVTVLASRGYEHIHAPFAADGDFGALLAWRVGPLEPVPGTEFLPHRAPVADLRLEDRQVVRVIGLYVPSRDRGASRNESKRAFQTSVIQALPGSSPPSTSRSSSPGT
jgi:hypothetical protein